MSTPAIIWIVLNCIVFGAITTDPNLLKDQTPGFRLVGLILEVALLYWGGFFS